MDAAPQQLEFGGSLLENPPDMLHFDYDSSLPDSLTGSTASGGDESDTADRSLASVDSASDQLFLPMTRMDEDAVLPSADSLTLPPHDTLMLPMSTASPVLVPPPPPSPTLDTASTSTGAHAFRTRQRNEKTSKSKGVKRGKLAVSDDEDDEDSEDLSHLDKRERNKRSAAKYRKRRKMYVSSLEKKISKYESHIDEQSCEISALQAENKQIREQLSYLQELVSATRSAMPAPAVDAKKASVFMFALFSCFLLTSPLWQADLLHNTEDAFDPSVAGHRGRVLLSIKEEFGCACSCSPPTNATTALAAASSGAVPWAAAAAAAATTAAVHMPQQHAVPIAA